MQDSTKVYPHYLKQAYQAEVLLRKPQIHSVGSRYPHKDHVVITTENIERSPSNPLFSIISLIDVVVKCENRIEAIKLNNALKEYFAKNMMLPLRVGVFQKPYTKDRERAQKHYAFANISAKELLEELPKLEKNQDLKFVVGASPVESNYILNGFDLTYSLTEYTMQGSFMTLEQMKELNKNAERPSYKLKLCTTSFFEVNEVSTHIFCNNWWKPLLKKLGIEYRRPYNMRHTFATNMLYKQLCTPLELSQYLGHANTRMIYDVYVSYIEGHFTSFKTDILLYS